MKKTKKSVLKPCLTLVAALLLAPAAIAGDAANGKQVYNGKGACAGCHGAGGAGDGAAAVAFNPKPASFVSAAFRLDTDGDGQPGTDADIANVIKNGAAKYGGNAGMPGRGDFSAAELADLVAFIRSLKQ